MTEPSAAPIGVFDSGVGGLSVLAHLYEQLPHEQYIYLADTLHVPYGARSPDNIRDLTLRAVAWLVNQGCKLVVVACNTASAHGLKAIRAYYPDLLTVGLVPALKPAVMHSLTKQVAVLATPPTLQGELLNEVIEQVALPQGVTVHKYSIASLVPWVEAGMPQTHLAVDELEQLLYELNDLSIDQLVLGCTHFPFFKPYLLEKIGEMAKKHALTVNLQLIDSGQAIAKRVASLLAHHPPDYPPMQSKDNQVVQNPNKLPALTFYSTANAILTEQVAQRLLWQFLPQVSVSFATAST